jgi:hypothetical protein
MFVTELSWNKHDHPVLDLLGDREKRHYHNHPRGELS